MLCLVGCSGPVGPTSGVVQFNDGSPVQSGSVELRRRGDRARFSSRISKDGTFRPMSESGIAGVPPGTYEAVVVQIVLTEDLASEDHTHGKTVSRRYADYYTSGLRVEVTEGQTDPIALKVTEQEDESDETDESLFLQ